ncbi:MAG: type II secretion system protein GspJ [bacterium]|nr:type II secretion system protein GspJ [bacterium]
MRFHHERRRSSLASSPTPISDYRPGYTLLELMLALALLGALLAVAWSLMGTYRDAEQKGWQLSMRTQTVRAIHSWLQQDIDHISVMVDDDNGASELLTTSFRRPLSKHGFRGTAVGFSVTIQASLAPLPFLERLLSPADLEPFDALERLNLDSSTDLLAPPSPWSDGPMRIDYRLVPATASTGPESLASASSQLTVRSASETTFLLSRIARRAPGMADRGPAPSSAPMASPVNATAADRVLTAQDLYRQTNDRSSDAFGPVVEESLVNGLLNARFRYFDGRNWLDEWNAANPSLPLAVALSFDMPQRFRNIVASVPQSTSSPFKAESASPSGGYSDRGISMADSALVSASLAELEVDEELSLIENASHEVHIVVRIQAAGSGTLSLAAGSAQGIVP